MLNKQKGNMYKFVTHTWNAIKGKCPHDCSYCYMKSFKVGELRLDEKTLKDNLGSSNFIFVGSSCDMFANKVPKDWILEVLGICKYYDKNTYLFQTKNPIKYFEVGLDNFPSNSIFGTTLESNRPYKTLSKAPIPKERIEWMMKLNRRKMVSIEPILEFDNVFDVCIEAIKPEFVSIGADSKGHNLPEPSAEKVNALIKELKKFTEVKIKDNLKRITEA